MTLFDLLFILLFFTALATLIAAAANAVRGRGTRALVLLRRLFFGAAGYLDKKRKR